MPETISVPNNSKYSNQRRSADEIRQDIAAEQQVLSHKVNRLTDVIHEKMDWRGYVKDYPYAALGVAAGIGLLLSKVFRRDPDPIDRVVEALNQRSERPKQQGLIAMTLMGLATKAAMNWINGPENKAVESRSKNYVDSVRDRNNTITENAPRIDDVEQLNYSQEGKNVY